MILLVTKLLGSRMIYNKQMLMKMLTGLLLQDINLSIVQFHQNQLYLVFQKEIQEMFNKHLKKYSMIIK